MSFSSDVKEEITGQVSGGRHCNIAEFAAIFSLCGRVKISEQNQYMIYVHTESFLVARKSYVLIKSLFDTDVEVVVRKNNNKKKSRVYLVVVKDNKIALKILHAIKFINSYGEIEENLSMVHNIVIQQQCCRRAFIRGAFLTVGAISDPKKGYHMEFTTTTIKKATQLQTIIGSFNIEAKIVQRKKYYIVYIKEGAYIVDLLNVIEAHVALMEFENIRIYKEVRNSINRKVNCETANINRTVNASSRQVEDISFIKEQGGFGDLSEGLRNVAELRIKYPDLSLAELGQMLDKPIGKSGVNHRLRKLSIIAEGLRESLKEESKKC